MRPGTHHLCASAVVALTAALVLALTMEPAKAGDPRGATYCPANDQILWFVHTSDTHIGTSGSTDGDALRWLVGPARSIINPSFIVVTGDLTDSTNGNIFGYPNGPYQAEWNEYRGIVDGAGAGPEFFYDLPGNHDAYNDETFAYYRANSVQGRATGRTQHSWLRYIGPRKYHFLGINSSDNSGDPFSFFKPYGDYAGLDAGELQYISDQLFLHRDANLTFVFGHHPVTDTGESGDTWLFYGHQQFVAALDDYGASHYGYGHTHAYGETQFAGNSYTGYMGNGGIRYANVSSLGKGSSGNFSVVAIDCDGVSSVTQASGTWPVVLITAPVSKYVGSAINPYAYTVPNAANSPVRALVFDANAVTSVSFGVDGGATQAMIRNATNTRLWEGTLDASGLAAGEHTLQVTAVGTSTRSQTMKVQVTVAEPINHPPVANDDSFAAVGASLSVSAPGVLDNDTDADGDVLAAALLSGAAHGSVALQQDGSFVYTANGGYSGTDSFTYTASDGVVSSTATVTLSVTAPTTDSVTVTAATFSQRTKVLTVTATSSQPNLTLIAQAFSSTAPVGTPWQLVWKPKQRVYTGSNTLTETPTTVTVTSSGGGTGTRNVQIKK